MISLELETLIRDVAWLLRERANLANGRIDLPVAGAPNCTVNEG